MNVFLAIAVDNLANSHILTADEEAEQKERENKRSINKEKYSSPKEEKKNGWTIAKGPLPAMLVMNHLKKNTNKQKEGESLEENLNAVGYMFKCLLFLKLYLTYSKSPRIIRT